MLLAINDRIKGWLGAVVVILIALPFGLWGIQHYLKDSGPQYAAKVNGTEISLRDFERTVTMQRQRLLQQNHDKLSIPDSIIRETTLKQMINQRLLEDVSYQSGYRVSDQVLSQRIKQLFTVDGKFDRARFEATVSQIGMSVPQYEQTLRNEMRVNQLQASVANTSFVTNQEVKMLAELNKQTRDFTVLTFNLDHFSTAGAPTEDEIKQYYKLNKNNFMRPEKVKVDYVEISSATIGNKVAVKEDKIKQMYQDYLAEMANKEEREASHILIKDKDDKKALERITKIKKEIDAGQDFATLAKQDSEDPGSANKGGDLGWVRPGDMVAPFEKVLFSLKKGQVSDIVKTQFGYHLIKLNDVRKEKPESFEAKRPELEAKFKSDIVDSEFYDLSERLANIAYENPDSLGAIVEQMGLKIKTSDYFTRNAGKGIAENSKVRNVAFSPLVKDQGSNSDVIELSPNDVVVIRLNELVPASPQPLDQVRTKIENIIRAEKGHQQTLDAALAVKAKLESGVSPDTVATDGVHIDKYTAINKTDHSKVKDPQVLTQAFTMHVKADGQRDVKQVDLLSGDVALVMLDKVNLPANLPKDELDSVRSEVVHDEATREFSSVLLSIKNNADIKENKQVLKE